MKRQRDKGSSGSAIAEGSMKAEIVTEKKARKGVEKSSKDVLVKVEDGKMKTSGGEVVVSGDAMGGGCEECWPWLCGVVDEQMSWGSVWLPYWDLNCMGEAYDALYSDVVWDEDIWNLKAIKEVPRTSEKV